MGPWLPEPLVDRAAAPFDDPAALQERADDLSIAFLLLLERLTPVERAVFLLRESFDFSYREIAGIVDKTEENCRQIDRRARKRLEEGRRPAPADPQEHNRLLQGFLRALKDGDLEGMVSLLARDATLYSDGGGKAHAAQRPIHGAESITRFLFGLRKNTPPDWEIRPALINGRTGLLNLTGGRIRNVMSFHVEDGKIQGIYIVVNPEKLERVET